MNGLSISLYIPKKKAHLLIGKQKLGRRKREEAIGKEIKGRRIGLAVADDNPEASVGRLVIRSDFEERSHKLMSVLFPSVKRARFGVGSCRFVIVLFLLQCLYIITTYFSFICFISISICPCLL